MSLTRQPRHRRLTEAQWCAIIFLSVVILLAGALGWSAHALLRGCP